MRKEYLPYIAIGQALAALLYPFAEVVLHDIRKNKIVAIFNSMSRRKVGDDSSLDDVLCQESLPDFFDPYFKTNWDGKKMKSTTITIKDSAEKPIGLLCINVEIQAFDDVRATLARFCGQEFAQPQPSLLFNEDWREKISLFVQDFLQKEQKSFKSLTRDEKRTLVLALYKEGAFKAKNAASYVADILNLSRATVYKYLAK